MTSKISEFQGDYRFLSNFWPSPMWVEGVYFPTVEHFYQAKKFTKPSHIEEIARATTPGKAKRLSRKFPLRYDWDDVKVSVMVLGITSKFTQNRDLEKMLLDTFPAHLVEGNRWHDNFWGDCYCDKCEGIEGKNTLGNLLMSLRDEVLTK